MVNRRTARTERAGGQAGASSGTVITLRDRSELIAVQRQLGATRNATDTLRAQTHEFDNQLHVISGLLQLREYDEVADLRRRAHPAPRRDRLRGDRPDRGPAAGRAAGREVQPGGGIGCPAADLTDVTLPAAGARPVRRRGDRRRQLVDNALDAVANSAQASITVEVTADDTAVHVVVSDTGPGVPPETKDHIFDRGFTTKSAAVVGGRGIGLSLVRRICEQRGGAVGLSFADGAVFTAVLPVEPPSDPSVIDTDRRVETASGAATVAATGKRG